MNSVLKYDNNIL